jgi:hypothetical protein
MDVQTISDDQNGELRKVIEDLFGESLHAKRILSLTHGALGVMASGSLAVSMIGHAMAQARGRLSKHGVKQVDRLLSNRGIDPWILAGCWIPERIGLRRDVLVAMDWTDYDADGQSTLCLHLVEPGNGRAQPLLWVSMHKDELLGQRNDIEDAALRRLAETVPSGTTVTILADRGFGDSKLFTFLDALGFSYVIRFKANTRVTAANGEVRTAAAWVGAGGRGRRLCGPTITASEIAIPAVICVRAKDMKEAWCLATNRPEATVKDTVALYARRWTIEPCFRDEKNLRFGMGLSELRIADPERRDRLLLLSALAIHFLTLLGIAGESLGMDRWLKTNTAKTRQHSLFRQGCMWFDLIPNMREDRLLPLMERFQELLKSPDYLAPLLASAK